MEMTHFIDWHDEYKNHPDRWLNHGHRVALDSCTHKTQDSGSEDRRETNMQYSGWCEECSFHEDSCEPMMNYGYPLYALPENDRILQVIQKTCLTVMENYDTGECFLVLCGGGLDLSQSIAHAYLLAGQRIPDELAFEVCTQPCLSVGKEEYVDVMQACIKELENIRQKTFSRIARIKNTLKEYELQKEGI